MLTERHWTILRAAMDAIVPADAAPSASQAGVEDYFRKQFEADLKGMLAQYAAGLSALDAEAVARGAAGFPEASRDAQDAILRALERGDARAAWTVPAVLFFEGLLNHVMEGYYADPENGGNRNAVSWAMLGFGGRRT
jgi:hypothetical protein